MDLHKDAMVIREGRLLENIKLGNAELVVGELSIKDRKKLFKVLEEEWKAFIAAHENEQQKAANGGLVGIIIEIFRTVLVLIFGEKAKSHIGKAIEIMNGVTTQDFEAVALCAIPFNEGLTRKKLKKLFSNAMASQVKDAMDKIYKINQVEDDIKNYLAAAQMMSGMAQSPANHPGGAASETSQGAMRPSSPSPGGLGSTSSAKPSHISNSSQGVKTQIH